MGTWGRIVFFLFTLFASGTGYPCDIFDDLHNFHVQRKKNPENLTHLTKYLLKKSTPPQDLGNWLSPPMSFYFPKIIKMLPTPTGLC